MMVGILLKKQLYEIFRNYFTDRRKNRATDLKGRNVPPKAARGAYYPVNGK